MRQVHQVLEAVAAGLAEAGTPFPESARARRTAEHRLATPREARLDIREQPEGQMELHQSINDIEPAGAEAAGDHSIKEPTSVTQCAQEACIQTAQRLRTWVPPV